MLLSFFFLFRLEKQDVERDTNKFFHINKNVKSAIIYRYAMPGSFCNNLLTNNIGNMTSDKFYVTRTRILHTLITNQLKVINRRRIFMQICIFFILHTFRVFHLKSIRLNIFYISYIFYVDTLLLPFPCNTLLLQLVVTCMINRLRIFMHLRET